MKSRGKQFGLMYKKDKTTLLDLAVVSVANKVNMCLSTCPV